jgi:hypothetical protein
VLLRQRLTKNRRSNSARLEKSADIHKSQLVIRGAQDIVSYTTAACGVDEIDFIGGDFGDDAYVAHDSSAGAMSFETDDISGSGIGDTDMHSGVVK